VDVPSAAGPASPVPKVSAARRRRRPNTVGENVALVGSAVVLGAAAAVWTDSSPTGLPAVDTVYRVALVALMVLAGERARRWSLLLGAGVTAAVATGVPRFGALVALAIMVFMAVMDRRSRSLDALAGGLIGLGALAIDVGGPLGLDAAIALIVTVPVLWTAYRYTSRRVQRRWRRGAVLLVLVAILCSAAAAVAAALSVSRVESAVEATREGLAATSEGDSEAAAAAFARANDEFVAADRLVGAVWARPARLVPLVGPNVAVVQESVALGDDLTAAASGVANDVDFDAVQRLDGGVDLATLESFDVPVERAAAAATAAGVVLDGLESPWVVGPLAERVDELSVEVDQLEEQTELALLGVTDGPAMLGGDGARRYLILLGNPAELRDMGGHLGNWAELVVDEGRLELVDVGGPMELALPPDQAPVWIKDELPLSLSVLKPAEFPQNWGGDPDTATVARLAGDLFEQRTGRPVDGVVYADAEAFAAFVQLTGPIAVPGLAQPYQLTADNAAQFLTQDQFELFEREVDADAAVQDVIEQVFSRLTNSQLPGPQSLGALFSPLVRSGHLQMGPRVDADERLVDRLGLSRRVDVPPGRDLLAVLQRNAGPNKVDAYLSRATDVQLQWNPSTGDVRSVVTVQLRNDAPAQGLDELVIGNRAGAPAGSNVTDVAVLSPFVLQSVSVDGSQVAAQPLLGSDVWRHSTRVVIPPGATRTVRFEMFGQVAPGDDYELTFVGQPIMGDNTLGVSMSAAGGAAELTSVGSDVPLSTSGVDAGADYVFSWRSGNQN
jgi:hypothetical protein